MSSQIDLATELAAVKAQLKEQTRQMAEMASMMKSMMSQAMPLLEEQTRKLRKEKEEAKAAWEKEEAKAKAAYKKQCAKRYDERNWSCPNDNLVHSWEMDGVKYLRNFEGQVWMDDKGQLGKWVGKWVDQYTAINTHAPEPEFD